jgi:phage-related protein
MANPETEVQKLVTEPIIDLIEFDFTSIGESAQVYLASSLQLSAGPGSTQEKFTWQTNTFEHIEFEASGFLSDLTGSTAEPTLKVSADLLFAIAAWPNTELIEYRGVIVKRRRLFENSVNAVQPQIYYIKKVNMLSATEIVFTLTPNRSTEKLNRPSSRKLDI